MTVISESGWTRRWRIVPSIAVLFFCLFPQPASAQSSTTIAATAETIRTTFVQAQLELPESVSAAQQLVAYAEPLYRNALAAQLTIQAPEAAARVDQGFILAYQALQQESIPQFAIARAVIWTALLDGAAMLGEAALARGELSTAEQWLALREFRVTAPVLNARFDLAKTIRSVQQGDLAADEAAQQVKIDLLDTYQQAFSEQLDRLVSLPLTASERRAERAALARGYFAILAPSYAAQRGEAATLTLQQALDDLVQQSFTGTALDISVIESALTDFRAAPLSIAEQKQRTAQLLRYLTLVPVEYRRGIQDGQVSSDIEIREAQVFLDGAQKAFIAVYDLLEQRDSIQTTTVQQALEDLTTQLQAAAAHEQVRSPDELSHQVDQTLATLRGLVPPEWQHAMEADFDLIATTLDQMEAAVNAGGYEQAESARLDAYAILESGPEAKITVFAPQLKQPIEGLFWYGQDAAPGLAALLAKRAPASEIAAARHLLDAQLMIAENILKGRNAPLAVGMNAAIIVFREGLEAILILASLLASMKVGAQRQYRRPLWWGALAALLASALTWLLAYRLLTTLARYGERLEAVVSLIAIAVLLLITNWFFHKVYWTGWIARFHSYKRHVLNEQVGQWLGLATLGFVSIYREGFETVLFLQALVLDAGLITVLGGVLLGFLATCALGWSIFRLQAKLPYKRMLIATGIMIGVVLVQMVGNTVYILQIVGWLPLHPLRWMTFPYWAGTWLGFYASWEGVALQFAAASFVLVSYFLAEYQQHRPKLEGRLPAVGD